MAPRNESEETTVGGPRAGASDVVVLPGVTSTQGIARGAGDTFYYGDLFRGHIYRGDLRRGTAELFVEAPRGRFAMGLWADLRHGWLFVGGGLGWAYVYDMETGETVAAYQLGEIDDLAATVVNKAFVNRDGAYFSDSSAGVLYFVPISPEGQLGQARTLLITGPAAEISGEFNLNGIVAPEDGEPLIVSHTANGRLYTVDPVSGVSRMVEGVDVPKADGLVLEGLRLWVVQNRVNQVSRVRLSPDLASGVVEEVITHDAFQFPATAVAFDDRLAVVNAKSDTAETGLPPTADEYEIVFVQR
ncbi:hypothetical protein ABZ816_30715 [Actinosynnema sp. NPDC047251]|uniref:Superoxide dismutase n=1 Tax=Saccharothrix espanaensis (strain ATCC 51144 / DSM 44229 / JCM 9112 / NBRC 15066 / NRRL 15764) TaxID=1179773 RepID=K0K375_SACES|nr:hypothetical protein [Saccharothrix espanaensis]CCH32761.1 hypothetical protein BN6_55020 [Saccharothrix espanaensis DSM 44229]